MSITGRTYTSTRPRGLADWRPQKKTKVLVDAILAVLHEYRHLLPLTNRQVFYRLVVASLIDKTEGGYEKLCEILNRARRAGFVPWEAIRDDGQTSEVPWGYDDPDDFLHTILLQARDYNRDPLQGQSLAVELWVEAAGMVPQAVRVARDYGVPVFSSGGFDSVTNKHAAARRFVESEVPTMVLHVGDYDASGCAVIDSAADDIANFVSDYGVPGIVQFERVAVTPEQVAAFSLPTAPPKTTDRRGGAMAFTVQAEAFAPDVLADVMRQAVERNVDLHALSALREVEGRERLLLVERLRSLEIGR